MSLVKLHVNKGDTVVVLAGKDKGKQGKIITAMPAAGLESLATLCYISRKGG